MKYRNLLLASLLLVGWLASHAKADRSVLGQSLPGLSLEYLKRAPSLEGKAVLLEFWATWCPPCRTTIPHLNTLHRKFADQGLVTIGVTSEDRPTIDSFLAKVPMSYVPAIDKDDALSNSFAITAIPHAVLYDRSGTAVWEGHPVELKEETVQTALASSSSRRGAASARGSGNEMEVLTSISVPKLRAMLDSAGYENSVDSDGDIVVKMHNLRGYFFVSETSVSYRITVKSKVTAAFINDWNKQWKYGRTYLDRDGDPVLQLDLDLDGGVTRKRIQDYIKTCETLMDKWTDKLAEL